MVHKLGRRVPGRSYLNLLSSAGNPCVVCFLCQLLMCRIEWSVVMGLSDEQIAQLLLELEDEEFLVHEASIFWRLYLLWWDVRFQNCKRSTRNKMRMLYDRSYRYRFSPIIIQFFASKPVQIDRIWNYDVIKILNCIYIFVWEGGEGCMSVCN